MVRWTVRSGVRQFLDIGTGIPVAPNVHEIAQEVHPGARVVYADNDPAVLTHARALLAGPAGTVGCIEADLRDPASVLDADGLGRVLDLGRPVGLLLVPVLHFVQDGDGPYGAVRRLVSALAPGSYLVISHATGDDAPAAWAKVQQMYRTDVHGRTAQVRSRAEVARFFTGLRLVEPGVEMVSRWRPEPGRHPGPVPGWAGVARIP